MATAREVSRQDLAEFAQPTSGKKATVRNATGEKQRIHQERVQLKHLLQKKKPLVRSNRTPRPKPTMSSGKFRDLHRDTVHNWQMVDGWCDGTTQRAQNETDYFGTWRKERLLEEATVKAISRR